MNIITTQAKLIKLAEESEARAKRNIENLIDRLEFFADTNQKEKLNECIAEAELWLSN